MSNVVAGIGRGQLMVLEQRIEKKRYIFEYYRKHLGDLEGLTFMPQSSEERSNCWLTAVQLSDECKVWKPLHLQPVFQNYDFISDVSELCMIDGEMGADNSIAGTIFRRGVCMPSDSKMTDEDLQRICQVVERLWKVG